MSANVMTTPSIGFSKAVEQHLPDEMRDPPLLCRTRRRQPSRPVRPGRGADREQRQVGLSELFFAPE
jgi:hypothetical protein